MVMHCIDKWKTLKQHRYIRSQALSSDDNSPHDAACMRACHSHSSGRGEEPGLGLAHGAPGTAG